MMAAVMAAAGVINEAYGSATPIWLTRAMAGMISCLALSLMMICGQSRLFQDPRSTSVATTPMGAAMLGSTTEKKVRNSLAPSMREASSISVGMLSINWRM